MSTSSVKQARHATQASRPAVSNASMTAAWTADVLRDKLQGEHDAVEDVRDRAAAYLDEATRSFPGAAGQLQTFLATQASGMMAIQAGLPPPPEPPMCPIGRELLELHDFVQKLDAQRSSAHSRLGSLPPRGAHGGGKTPRGMLSNEIQAASYKLRGLTLLMDNACLEMPEAHQELKLFLDASPGDAHAHGDLSIKATILFNMVKAKAECRTHYEEAARKLRELEGRPANDSGNTGSVQGASDAAQPVLPPPRSALMRTANCVNQPRLKVPQALPRRRLPATPVRVSSAQARADTLGNLQTNHLENLELQAGVEQQFLQLTRAHPEATVAMWTFLEKRSYADIDAIATDTGYLVPGFEDLPSEVGSLVALHAQCLAIAADCMHTQDQILELGARSRVLGARQKNSADAAGASEQGERNALIERNKDDIRKAYLVVTSLSATNPKVLDEMRDYILALSAAGPARKAGLSQQARIALFYDRVRKEKYRENAQLQALLNSMGSEAGLADVQPPKSQGAGTRNR